MDYNYVIWYGASTIYRRIHFLSPDGSVRDSNMEISMNEECDDYTDDLFEDINGRNQFLD